jgi:hypothetical protein
MSSCQENRYFRSLFIGLAAAIFVCACGNEKEVTFKSGGMTHTFAEGQDATPKDFPLPIYKGAVATGSVSAEGDNNEQSKFLMLSTADPLDKVSEYYQRELKGRGWQIENVQTWAKLVSISAKQKDLEANVMLADDGGKTTISLSAGRAVEDKTEESDAENYKPEKLNLPTD